MSNSTLTEEQPTVEELQALLRDARSFIYHAGCSSEAEYDEQQALLERIGIVAPEPPPPPPKETCGKEGPHGAQCINDKGHEGDCDDLPF